MDVVIAAVGTVAEMKAFQADMRSRLGAQGRDPDDCKVMFVFTPTLGETAEEAQGRYERKLERKANSPEEILSLMASLTDIDFAAFDLDEPLKNLTTNGQQGTLRQFLAQGSTLREIATNYRFGFEDVYGTPEQVADTMGDVMAEVGGDGFMFSAPLNRRYVAEITEGLVTALQERGLVRTSYAHDQFRENLFAF
jgi:alkanesulfonate monooxygenase SsuD/methylene tetrahydromethanopterin reductase-like flavin-dependent oxidoreductase (luciferase family)